MEVGDCGSETTGEQGAPSGTIRLQSFQRGRGCLLERYRVLPDGSQRFAEPRPDLNRNPSERIQDLFFSFCFRLFLAKDVSGETVSGA